VMRAPHLHFALLKPTPVYWEPQSQLRFVGCRTKIRRPLASGPPKLASESLPLPSARRRASTPRIAAGSDSMVLKWMCTCAACRDPKCRLIGFPGYLVQPECALALAPIAGGWAAPLGVSRPSPPPARSQSCARRGARRLAVTVSDARPRRVWGLGGFST
jgi:hypothetical protein